MKQTNPTNLVLDSTFFYQQLFNKGQVLALLTSLSRDGKFFLFVPWIVHQEVLSNMRPWSLKHFGAPADFTARSLAAGVAIDEAAVATEATTRAIEKLAEQIRAKYENWLKASDCTVIPFDVETAMSAWTAYFEGAPPFPTRKVREHLPDAHIFYALKQLADHRGPCVFLTSDGNLRSYSEAITGVTAFSKLFPIFQGIGLDEHFRKFIRDCPLVNALPIAESRMTAAIERDLRGKRAGEESIHTAKVKELRVREQGTIPMGPSSALVGFEAEVDLQVEVTSIESLTKTIQSRGIEARIEGHVLVDLTQESGELDDFTVIGAAETSPVVTTTLNIDPVVEVGWLHNREMHAGLAHFRGGIIAVIGGTGIERRKIAEALAIKRLSLVGESQSAVRLFDLQEANPRVPKTPLTDLMTLVEIERPNVVCFDPDSPYSLEAVLGVAKSHRDILFIVPMKRPKSGEQVVRELYKLDPAADYLDVLRAYANVTERERGKTIFNFNTGSGWGDGSWDVVLQRDEMMGRWRD